MAALRDEGIRTRFRHTVSCTALVQRQSDQLRVVGLGVLHSCVMGRYECDGKAGLPKRRHFGTLRRNRDPVARILPAKHVVVDQHLVVAGQHVCEQVLATCVVKNDFTGRDNDVASELKGRYCNNRYESFTYFIRRIKQLLIHQSIANRQAFYDQIHRFYFLKSYLLLQLR